MPRRLSLRRERFPIRGHFTISRGSRTEAEVVAVEIAEGAAVGRGESVPYGRYGETVDSVAAQIDSVSAAIAEGLDRIGLLASLPAGAARNAVDCALWDLEAKLSGRRVWDLAGLPEPQPLVTAFTLSLDSVEAMARAATEAAWRPLLKLKLTGDGDLERVAAVRRSAPRARLIVDANEAWSMAHLERFAESFRDLGVELIEQPLPAGSDDALRGFTSPVPLCADESCHDTATLPRLAGKYAFANIKLDKTGGLTEALRLSAAARAAGYGIMVGCMVGTSLAMAPAVVVAQAVAVVDLDGPLLLARDRMPGLRYDEAGRVHPPPSALWG